MGKVPVKSDCEWCGREAYLSVCISKTSGKKVAQYQCLNCMHTTEVVYDDGHSTEGASDE